MIRDKLLAAVFCLAVSTGWAADGNGSAGNARSLSHQKDTAVKQESYLEDESLVQVLRTTNKAQVNKYVSAALRFENVNPYNVINFFWAATSREEGGIYSFVHPEEERGYIVVICPEYQLPWLRDLAKQLDRPKLTSAPGSKYIYYRMKHRNITDPGFRRVISYYLGRSGVVLPDIETNSVLIFDAPEGAMATEAAINEILDVPLKQIELNVHLYEIDVHNDQALGLDYESWKNGPGRNLAQFSARGVDLRGKGISPVEISENGSGLFLDYSSAYFDFLVDKGKAKTLLDTKIVAVSGVPALLTTGEQFLFYDVINGSTNDRQVRGTLTNLETDPEVFPTHGDTFVGSDKPVGGGGLRGTIRAPFRTVGIDPPYPQTQYPQNRRPINSAINAVDTGVTLAVVPTIGEKMVNLDLNLKVVGVTGFDNSGEPLLNSRQFRDSIGVAVGDEVVFGGLSRERTIQTTAKVPFFGSLPVVGYLFGREITTKSKKLIVATVEPLVVKNGANPTVDHEEIVNQASGEAVVVLPETEFCFDQSFRVTY